MQPGDSASPSTSGRGRSLERAAAFLPLGLALLASVLASRSGAAWFGPTEQLLSAITVLCTAAATFAIVRDDVRARVWVASAMLLGAPALRVGELLGHTHEYVTWDHGPVASMVTVAVIVAIVGLLQRREWGRWIGLGGSLAGLGGAVINGLGSLAYPGVFTWGHACTAAGCGALVLLLSGPSMRDAFEGTTTSASLWRSREPVVRALRWTLISTLVSAPMLLVYGVTQTVVDGTREVALVLAGVQLVATALCLGRKVLGALLLALAGSALLVFTLVCGVAALELSADHRWIMAYYAVFWVPAGVGSVVAGAVMLRPLRALLRTSS